MRIEDFNRAKEIRSQIADLKEQNVLIEGSELVTFNTGNVEIASFTNGEVLDACKKTVLVGLGAKIYALEEEFKDL